MAIRYVPIAAIVTLLSAAVTVAQPQTTDPNTDQSTPTGATATQTTPSASTPATNPGSTTTGTATDTSTGSQGMQGGFRGTPADPSTSDTSTATGTTGSTTTSSSATDADAATSTTTTGAATAAATTAGSSQLQGQDAMFLRKAIEGDRMEIASAQAALDNAERADTKSTARMIVDDHQKSSQALLALASRKGWTLPSAAMSTDDDQAMTDTSGSGSVDDQFMAEQIRMHREAISLYRAQIASGSDPDLRQFARDQLPHLEHHLEMLQGANTQK